MVEYPCWYDPLRFSLRPSDFISETRKLKVKGRDFEASMLMVLRLLVVVDVLVHAILVLMG